MIEQPELIEIPFVRLTRTHRLALPTDYAHIVECGNWERRLWVRVNESPMLRPMSHWLVRSYRRVLHGGEEVIQAWCAAQCQPVQCRIRMVDDLPVLEWHGVTIGDWVSLAGSGTVATLYVPR